MHSTSNLNQVWSTLNLDRPCEIDLFALAEITHHNEVAKLRKLHQAVKATRQKVAGCTDATATNYDASAVVDDGTCEYIISVSALRICRDSAGLCDSFPAWCSVFASGVGCCLGGGFVWPAAPCHQMRAQMDL